MARRKGRRAAKPPRLGGAGIRLLLIGATVLLVPGLFGNTAFAKALGALRPFGWMVLLAGVVVTWIAWFRGQPGAGGSAKAWAAAPAVPAWTQPEPGAAHSVPFGREAAREALGVAPHPPHGRTMAPLPGPGGPADSRPAAWGREVFDVIEWRRFEAVVEHLFRQAGFKTRAQSHGADMGVDVWLYSSSDPGRPVSLVQCKHWQGKRVGVDKVRELRGVMAAHQVSRGQFATTSTFTSEALTFGKDNGINLLDVNRLLALIAQRTPAQQAELLAVALEGDYARPTCVNCGRKMVERMPRKGGNAFWGCPGYPACKTTLPMRQDRA